MNYDESVLLGALNLTGLETRNMLGVSAASGANSAGAMVAGSAAVSVRSSAPPQPAASSMNPFTHFSTNSARRTHHAAVISSDISCRSSSGMARLVMSLLHAAFSMLRRPRMAGWRDVMSPDRSEESSTMRWKTTCTSARLLCFVMKMSPVCRSRRLRPRAPALSACTR